MIGYASRELYNAITLFIFLAVLPSFAGEKEQNRFEPSIAVVLSFDEPYSPLAIGEMKRELESILRSCNVPIQWRVLDESVYRESFSDLLVARFHGGCHEMKEEHSLQLGALGYTEVSDGHVLSFSDIDCTKVRRFVRPEVSSMSFPRSEKALGRALGRVLAHEMYHIIGKTEHHGEHGVAKAFLTAEELVRGSLRLERVESDLIHNRFFTRRK